MSINKKQLSFIVELDMMLQSTFASNPNLSRGSHGGSNQAVNISYLDSGGTMYVVRLDILLQILHDMRTNIPTEGGEYNKVRVLLNKILKIVNPKIDNKNKRLDKKSNELLTKLIYPLSYVLPNDDGTVQLHIESSTGELSPVDLNAPPF